MNARVKSLIAILLVVAAAAIYFFVASPLRRFTRRIANVDRVVATMSKSPVSIAITGEDAKLLVQAVSSAKRERPPWGMGDACIYEVRLAFLEGTNGLGDLLSCGHLFIVSGKKYRDDTGLLGTLAVTPIHNAYAEWWRKQ
jgi:HAMP domain-containing protein